MNFIDRIANHYRDTFGHMPVHIAQAIDGCVGARLTGAGFGGCTVNLVESGKVESFVRSLGKGYEAETGLHAEIYVTHAAAGAELLQEKPR